MPQNGQVVVVQPKKDKGKTVKSLKSFLKKNPNLLTKKIGSSQTTKKVKFVTEKESIPVVYSRKVNMNSPKTKDLGKGNMRIVHQELVTEIRTAKTTNGQNNGFVLYKIHVNPGLQDSFPWLSSLARNFKNYKFWMLALCFVPRNNVVQAGTSMMYCEYDPDASDPENRKDLLNRKQAAEIQVFKDLDFFAEMEELAKEKSHYIRTGPPLKNQDIKLQDCANFYYAYDGTSPDTLIGDLFFQYTVDLITPDLQIGRNLITRIESVTVPSKPGSATTVLPFGVTDIAKIAGDFAGALLDTATGGFAGNLFSTGKQILKFIQSYLPVRSDSITPTAPTLSLHERVKNLDDKVSINIRNEDDFDELLLASNTTDETDFSSKFINITNTNVTLNSDARDVNGHRFTSWIVAVPANAIIRFSYPTTGTVYPADATPLLNLFDANGSKVGINLLAVDVNI